MNGAARYRWAIGAILPLVVAGCSLDPSIWGPTLTGPTVIGQPKNAIERALSFCATKTEAGETACVRQALVDGKLGPAALAATIPRCRVGTTCTLEYRTRDRAGVLSATASDYVADWLVTFDLKKPASTPADLPLTVQQI